METNASHTPVMRVDRWTGMVQGPERTEGRHRNTRSQREEQGVPVGDSRWPISDLPMERAFAPCIGNAERNGGLFWPVGPHA